VDFIIMVLAFKMVDDLLPVGGQNITRVPLQSLVDLDMSRANQI
jgi:hypothetical protein